MTLKLKGADLKAFMEDREFWWDGRWYEEAELSINGGPWFDWDGEEIKDTDSLRWRGGVVYDGPDDRDGYGLQPKLLAWLKGRVHTLVVLEIHKDHLAAVKELINATPGVRMFK